MIGHRPDSDFTDPIGLLTDCHRRIEKFLGVLQKVAQQSNFGRLDDEHRKALSVALRYFYESAPNHMPDEEDSLFPRMLSRAYSDFKGIVTVLQRLDGDHRLLSDEHARVDR